MSESNIKKNFAYAFLAQGISLFFSLISSLLIPKIVGEVDFGYWQLFLFYSSYVGVLHLGWLDGIYLKLGGKKREELDQNEFSSQLAMLQFYLLGLALFAAAIIMVFVQNPEKRFVWYMTLVAAILINLFTYMGYVLQAINDIKAYSLASILENACFIALVALLLLSGVKVYRWYVLSFIAGKALSAAYLLLHTRNLQRKRPRITKQTWAHIFDNIKIGVNLLIANLAGMLILGLSRMVIEQKWGLLKFSEFSFALSLSNFFLMFVSQVSLVLFPALRRFDQGKQASIYKKMLNTTGIVMCAALALYPLLYRLIAFWLPQYERSLYYLIFILPICLYDGKMQMLFNTYYKVLRKEKFMLIVNVLAAAVSFGGALLGAFVFDSVLFVIMAAVFAIMLRTVISNIYLSRLMQDPWVTTVSGELILMILFVLLFSQLDMLRAGLLYLAAYLLYAGVFYLQQRKLKRT